MTVDGSPRSDELCIYSRRIINPPRWSDPREIYTDRKVSQKLKGLHTKTKSILQKLLGPLGKLTRPSQQIIRVE